MKINKQKKEKYIVITIYPCVLLIHTFFLFKWIDLLL